MKKLIVALNIMLVFLLVHCEAEKHTKKEDRETKKTSKRNKQQARKQSLQYAHHAERALIYLVNARKALANRDGKNGEELLMGARNELESAYPIPGGNKYEAIRAIDDAMFWSEKRKFKKAVRSTKKAIKFVRKGKKKAVKNKK